MNRPSRSQDDYDPRRGHNQDDYAAWVKSLLYPPSTPDEWLAMCEFTDDEWTVWNHETR